MPGSARRFVSATNQFPHCWLRFQVFARCARELGEDDTRCKYQSRRPRGFSPALRFAASLSMDLLTLEEFRILVDLDFLSISLGFEGVLSDG